MSVSALQAPNRNSVTTIKADGSHRFLFPAEARGRFSRARGVVAWALIAFYLSLPWIPINGYPAVFLDVADRRFHLFGITLAAQDLWLLFFLITGMGFSLFFVTAMLGRIWCGWACPQTVFLDHVYRRIERWIDGDATRRRALRQSPMTFGKAVRRVSKHALYLLVSAIITHLLLAYFVSLPEVWSMVRAAPLEHWGAFGFIAIATGALYFNFAWFREQLCIVICPYGRIQSALIDDHSLVIGYDAARGEPRGPIRRTEVGGLRYEGRQPVSQPSVPADLNPLTSHLTPHTSDLRAPEARGDCVDCTRCVQVCPTGIDIRQGLQMECIGCTACIDACDDVMTRLHRSRGLIRYDSQTAFAGGRTRWLRPRTLMYGVLLLVGSTVAAWALSTVKPAAFGVTRMIGAPYVVDETSVRNQFLVRIVNKRNEPARFLLELQKIPGDVHQVGLTTAVELGAMEEIVQPLILRQPRSTYAGAFPFVIRVENLEKTFHLDRTVEFLGPEPHLLREDTTP